MERWVLRLLIVSFVVMSLGFFGWLAMEAIFFTGPTSCELGSGTSIYGEATWSWFPPGASCTWELGRGQIVEIGPPLGRLAIELLLVLWGVSLILLRSRSKSPTSAVREDAGVPSTP